MFTTSNLWAAADAYKIINEIKATVQETNQLLAQDSVKPLALQANKLYEQKMKAETQRNRILQEIDKIEKDKCIFLETNPEVQNLRNQLAQIVNSIKTLYQTIADQLMPLYEKLNKEKNTATINTIEQQIKEMSTPIEKQIDARKKEQEKVVSQLDLLLGQFNEKINELHKKENEEFRKLIDDEN